MTRDVSVEEVRVLRGEVGREVQGGIACSSSGRGKLVIGCDDGAVSLLNRGLKFNCGFHAHSSSVLFLQQLKVRTLTPSQLSTLAKSVCALSYARMGLIGVYFEVVFSNSDEPFTRIKVGR
ncbi:hypothetical protein NL676_019422 [Syzygium grande]|nr:hypothetical protein NL676_019422 [Syzygium grande]